MLEFFLILSFSALVLPQAFSSVTIYLDDPKQKIVVMGADMERSAHFLQRAANKEEVIKWVFKDTQGVLYLRIAFDKHQELIRGQKNMAYYDLQVASMQQIKAVNPDIRFWATMKTDYDGFGKRNNLPDWIYKGRGYDGGRYDPNLLDVYHYTSFLVDYLEYMYQKRVPIYALTVGKEWSQVISAKKASQVIRSLKKECDRRRIPVPIFVGPATWGVKGGISDLKKIKAMDDSALYAGFCAHQYDDPTEWQWRQFIKLAASMGKLAFDDETNLGSGGRSHGNEVDIALPIKVYSKRARTYRAGLSGEVFFENWSRGVNSETRSIYFRKNQKARRLRGYWIFKEFTGNTMSGNYIPTRLADGFDGLETMTFRIENTVTIWVMNSRDSDVEGFDFQIRGASLLRKQAIGVKWWCDLVTDPRGDDDRFQPISSDLFKWTIPAQSISRIIFELNEAD